MPSVADIIAEKCFDLVSIEEWTGAGLDNQSLRVLTRRIAIVPDDQLASAEIALAAIKTVNGPVVGPNAQAFPGAWKSVKVSRGKLRATEATMGLFQVLVQGALLSAQVRIENNCAFEVNATYYWLSPTPPTTPANYAAHTYTVQMSYQHELGLWNGAILEKVRLYQDTEFYRSGGDYFEDVQERKQQGVTTEPIPDMTMEPRLLKTQDIAQDQDCTKSVQSGQRRAIARANVARSKSVAAFEITSSQSDRNQDDALSAPDTQTPGIIDAMQSEITAAQVWNNELRRRQSQYVEHARRNYVTNFFERVSGDSDRNAVTAAGDPGFTPGTIIDAEDAANDFLRYDRSSRTRTGIARANARNSWRETAFERVGGQGDRNMDSGPTDIVFVPGRIIEATMARNELGLYENDTNPRVAKTVAAATKTGQSNFFGSTREVADRNAVDPADLPDDSDFIAGSPILDVTAPMNEAARYDNRTVTRKPFPRVIPEVLVHEDAESKTYMERGFAIRDADVPATAFEEGQLTEVSPEPDAWGLRNYQKSRKMSVTSESPDFECTDSNGIHNSKIWFAEPEETVQAKINAYVASHPDQDVGMGYHLMRGPDKRWQFRLHAQPSGIKPPSNEVWEGFGERQLGPLHDTRNREFWVYMLYTSHLPNAVSFANQCPTTNYFTLGDCSGHSTGFFHRGNGRWMGVRVEGFKADFGAP